MESGYTNESNHLVERCSGRNCTHFAPQTTPLSHVTSMTNGATQVSTTDRYRVAASHAAGKSA